LMYYGNRTKFEERYFDTFPGLPSPTSSSPTVDTIEIKWVRISGPEFSSHLAFYASTLRVLHLENVTIEGHLQPIRLPHLEKFFLQQGLEPEEVTNADYVMSHGPTPWVHSTLFFLNDSSSTLAEKMAKVYVANINVTVYLKGSVNYQLNPGANEVKLDNSDCNEVLSTLPQTVTRLTLGRCRDLTPTSINSVVKFLNFYLVSLTAAQLSELLKNLVQLEEFYSEIPDVDFNMENLSPTVKLLSLSSMRIINNGNQSYPMIKEFYFGSENQYGWIPNRVTSLNESFVNSFGQIFPNVEKVGLFDLTNGERYIFLESVLKTPTIAWLGLENFLRGTNGSLDTAMGMEAYEFVEGQLDELGLEKDASDIVIEYSWFGIRIGRIMSHFEKLQLRYTLLCWFTFDSWPKYVYVQKIIEGGGILI